MVDRDVTPMGCDIEHHPKDIIRFIEKIKVENRGHITSCWIWLAYLDKDGYARFSFGSRRDGTRKTWLAHRWSYSVFCRPLLPGLTVDHLCRQSDCVCPWHLEQLPLKKNVIRMHQANGRALPPQEEVVEELSESDREFYASL